jgi:hypothetical protein
MINLQDLIKIWFNRYNYITFNKKLIRYHTTKWVRNVHICFTIDMERDRYGERASLCISISMYIYGLHTASMLRDTHVW